PRPRALRTRVLPAALAISLLLAGTTACGGSSGGSGQVSAKAASLGTIKPGEIKVAIEPYAPYTSMQGNKMVGLDADILNAAAAKLGLTVKPVNTDFAGMLASVQA